MTRLHPLGSLRLWLNALCLMLVMAPFFTQRASGQIAIGTYPKEYIFAQPASRFVGYSASSNSPNNSSQIFKVYFAHNTNPPDVYWYKDGQPAPNSVRMAAVDTDPFTQLKLYKTDATGNKFPLFYDPYFPSLGTLSTSQVLLPASGAVNNINGGTIFPSVKATGAQWAIGFDTAPTDSVTVATYTSVIITNATLTGVTLATGSIATGTVTGVTVTGAAVTGAIIAGTSVAGSAVFAGNVTAGSLSAGTIGTITGGSLFGGTMSAAPATATRYTLSATAGNARQMWMGYLTVSSPTFADAGIYYAKIGNLDVPTSWTTTNFAQLAVLPDDPTVPPEIVRQPQSTSGSQNVDFQLYADPRSHVTGLLRSPFGAATDSNGFTYIADTLNSTIRRISPGGNFTTVAGLDGQSGGGNKAFISQPSTSGTLATAPGLYAQALSAKERDPLTTITFRDGVSNQSPTDTSSYRFLSAPNIAVGNEPLFNKPESITVSDIGVVYVADTGNNVIRRIRTQSLVTTVTTLGNFTPTNTKFNSPRGIAFAGSSADPINNPPCLYVVDSGNYTIKKLYLDPVTGVLDTTKGDPDAANPALKTGIEYIAGAQLTPGWQAIPTSGIDTRFYAPRGIVATKDPDTGVDVLYIADTVNHVIRQLKKVNNAWTASTVVGFVGAKLNPVTPASLTGVGTSARLSYPMGMALDEQRQILYFTEFGTHCLRCVYLPHNSMSRPDWTVDLVAGSGSYGPIDISISKGIGPGASAQFWYPAGISYNKTDGSILLADSSNHCIRKVSLGTSVAGGTAGASGTVITGTSNTFTGTVGLPGNRDFSALTEYYYQWFKDGVGLTDSGTPTPASSIVAGSNGSTLTIGTVQYTDSGVYAVRFANVYDRLRESDQASVYVATLGDPPRFTSPGYHLELASNPGVQVSSPTSGADLNVMADIVPADQVNYQWYVAADTASPQWIALADKPIDILTKNNPADPDRAANALRVQLGQLLGTTTTTVSGSTTNKLTITAFQGTLATPPKLRFRVVATTKTTTPITLDTKVPNTSLLGTWTVSDSLPQPINVNSAAGLSVGMYLVGSGIPANAKITAINTFSPSNPIVYIDQLASAPGTNLVIAAATDLSSGQAVSIKYPVQITDPSLSFKSTSDPASNSSPDGVIKLDGDDTEALMVQAGKQMTLSLYSGSASFSANPDPTYQWWSSPVKFASTAPIPSSAKRLSGQTNSYLTQTVSATDPPLYYFVVLDNQIGNAPKRSNLARVEPSQTRSLAISKVSQTAAGSPTADPSVPREVAVDLTNGNTGFILTAALDIRGYSGAGSVFYDWSYKSDSTGLTQSLITGGDSKSGTVQKGFTMCGAANFSANLSSASLNFPTVDNDADGYYTLNVRIPDAADPTKNLAGTYTWHVTVVHPPVYVNGTKQFTVTANGSPVTIAPYSSTSTVNGTLNTVYIPAFKAQLDLTKTNSIVMSAQFRKPPSEPVSSLKYRWKFGNVYLSDSVVDGISGSSTNTLTLTNPARNWMGNYILEVSNSHGSKMIVGAANFGETSVDPGPDLGWTLFSNGAPSILGQPRLLSLWSGGTTAASALSGVLAAAPKAVAGPAVSGIQHVAVGKPVALVFSVDATPLPSYQWYKKTAQMTSFLPAETGSLARLAQSAVYIIPAVNDVPTTVNTYKATAQNGVGSSVTSQEIQVRVDSLPDPTISISSTMAPLASGKYPAGASVTFTASVSDPGSDYRYQWKLNGAPILGATDTKLTLLNIGGGNSGTYSVVVTSPAYGVSVEGTPPGGSSNATSLFPENWNGITLAVDTTGSTDTLYTAKLQTPANNVFTIAAANSAWTNYGQSSVKAAAGTKITIESPTIIRGNANAYSYSSLPLPVSGYQSVLGFLQNWTVTAVDPVTKLPYVWAILPARDTQFVMPASDVTITPTISRTYAGTYSGLLTLDAPWITDEGMEWAQDDNGHRLVSGAIKPDSARGYFTATVNYRGTISGRFVIENGGGTNGGGSFTAALDSNMQARFKVTTTMKGAPWVISGTISFNNSDTNAAANFTDNVMHVTIDGAILTTPPLVVGLPLYCAAAGSFGAVDALKTSLAEALSVPGNQASVTAIEFTTAAYRQNDVNSLGRGGVFYVQVTPTVGTALIKGYLPNGVPTAFSTSLGIPYVVTASVDPQGLYPDFMPAVDYALPTPVTLEGVASNTMTESLVRQTLTPSIYLWLRGDSRIQPIFGSMLFKATSVYGCIGMLNADLVQNTSYYTANALAGYFYDKTDPKLAIMPNTPFISGVSIGNATMQTYLSSGGLSVAGANPITVGSSNSSINLTFDPTSGLLNGGFLEVNLADPLAYSVPAYAKGKTGAANVSLACSMFGAVIQSGNLLPNLTPAPSLTPSSLGGIFGFVYRGKNGALEPVKNVLGAGALDAYFVKPPSPLSTGTYTTRVEAFKIDLNNDN